MAQVEPFPFVPATTMVGAAKAMPRRALTAAIRSSVSSIVFGCSR
jgi:hypothetical protein